MRLEHDIHPVRWDGKSLQLLDQRLLPNQETYLTYAAPSAVAEAITDMVVQGAPAIGIAAAYAMVLAYDNLPNGSPAERDAAWKSAKDTLAKSRPTAVNLCWALNLMDGVYQSVNVTSDVRQRLADQAVAVHNEDVANNRTMAQYGAPLFPKGASVYTHCNAGALATGALALPWVSLRRHFTRVAFLRYSRAKPVLGSGGPSHRLGTPEGRHSGETCDGRCGG